MIVLIRKLSARDIFLNFILVEVELPNNEIIVEIKMRNCVEYCTNAMHSTSYCTASLLSSYIQRRGVVPSCSKIVHSTEHKYYLP